VRERLGTNTLTYLATVCGGLIDVPDGGDLWDGFLLAHPQELWLLCGRIARGDCNARREAEAFERRVNAHLDLAGRTEAPAWPAPTLPEGDLLCDGEPLTQPSADLALAAAQPASAPTFLATCDEHSGTIWAEARFIDFFDDYEEKRREGKDTPFDALLESLSDLLRKHHRVVQCLDLPAWRSERSHLIPAQGWIEVEVAPTAEGGLALTAPPRLVGVTPADVGLHPELAEAADLLAFYRASYAVTLVVRREGAEVRWTTRQPWGGVNLGLAVRALEAEGGPHADAFRALHAELSQLADPASDAGPRLLEELLSSIRGPFLAFEWDRPDEGEDEDEGEGEETASR